MILFVSITIVLFVVCSLALILGWNSLSFLAGMILNFACANFNIIYRIWVIPNHHLKIRYKIKNSWFLLLGRKVRCFYIVCGDHENGLFNYDAWNDEYIILYCNKFVNNANQDTEWYIRQVSKISKSCNDQHFNREIKDYEFKVDKLQYACLFDKKNILVAIFISQT